MQQRLIRDTHVTKHQFITAYELLERKLWWKFCDLRNIDLFAVHDGKIKETHRFRLTPYEIRILGLCKKV